MTLQEFKEYAKNPKEVTNARNSMGCCESFYNHYYLIFSSLGCEIIDTLTEREFELLCQVAEFATEVFY